MAAMPAKSISNVPIRVWIERETDVFEPATIVEHEPNQDRVKATIESSNEVVVLERSIVYRRNKPWQIDTPDLTSLSYVNLPNIIHSLQQRYEAEKIYSLISSVLVAVNPYRQLPIYNSESMLQYRTHPDGTVR